MQAMSAPDNKMLSPFIIIAKHGTSCELKLLLGMKVYPTFLVQLLLKDPSDLLPGQRNLPPKPIIATDKQEWEVENVIASRYYRKQL